MAEDLESILRKSPLTKAQRADLWDAFEGAANEDDLASALERYSAPKEVKARLWDLKASSSSPVDATPAKPDLASPSMQAAGRQPSGKDHAARELGKGGLGALKGAGQQALDIGSGAVALGKAVISDATEPERWVPGMEIISTAAGRPVPSRTGEIVKGAAQQFASNAQTRAQAMQDQIRMSGAPAIPYGGGIGALLTPEGREAARQMLHMVVPEKGLDIFSPETRPEDAGREFTNVVASAGPGKTLRAVENVTGLRATAPVTMAAGALEDTSRWLGRSALKPTVAAMQKISGAVGEGINVKANQLVDFIIENKIATPEKAAQIMKQAGQELDRILSLKNAPTDAAQRAQRYLDALERRFKKATNAEGKAALVREKGRELLRGEIGEDAFKLEGDELIPTRQLRENIPAQEALERARASSKASTSDQWGDIKGVEIEANKAIERGYRDSVKAAVPEAKPLLRRQGQAIEAKKALDRMEFREANREPVGLAGQAIAGAEMVGGKAPVMGFAAELVRNSKLRAAFLADDVAKVLERAVAQGNTPQVAFILHKAGIAVPPESMRPAAPGAPLVFPRLPQAAEDERKRRVASR